MVVITLSDCPKALKGDLTKWLLEVSPGVYVGQVSARVRDNLWDRVCRLLKNGKATMVFNARNEQGLDFRSHGSKWEPIDFDGVKLVLHPSPARIKALSKLRLGYSNASKYRKAKKMAGSSG
jgi:CRISPR-associated protein Cas2